ncbi:MAG TPA: iron chelate uptake ABC transporter family permease subunit, partial [Candidatus Cybelea sp.]|nr:iron chelate uptake ABC transporter family permease subunit [Candidatus Cybelea sp.]
MKPPTAVALALLVPAAAAVSLLVGGTQLSIVQIAGELVHPHRGSVIYAIVWQLRLPRVCIAATVGASLALCGAMLQGMLRNPLADPYLTGVSAAAAAAIALSVLAGAAIGVLPMVGFLAGLGAALLVAALARRGDPRVAISFRPPTRAVLDAVDTILAERAGPGFPVVKVAPYFDAARTKK